MEEKKSENSNHISGGLSVIQQFNELFNIGKPKSLTEDVFRPNNFHAPWPSTICNQVMMQTNELSTFLHCKKKEEDANRSNKRKLDSCQGEFPETTSVFSRPLTESNEGSEADFGSNSVLTKVIICQYPGAKLSLPRSQRPSVCVRFNYWKDKNPKKSGDDSSKFKTDAVSLSHVCGKQDPMLKNGGRKKHTLSDHMMVRKMPKDPYVNLGFRCDSKEFKEKIVARTSQPPCDVHPRRLESVHDGWQKSFSLNPVGNAEKDHRKKSQNNMPMIRIDYKPTSTRNHVWGGPKRSRQNSGQWHQSTSSNSDVQDSSRSITNTPLSDCWMERLELDLSSDEEEGKLLASITPKVIFQTVNLPIDIVRTKKKDNNSVIVDGQRLINLLVNKLKGPGLCCGECSSALPAGTVIRQLLESE